MNQIIEINNWSNADNIEFYEKIPVNQFREFSIRGGFEEGCDIDLVFPYIKNCKNVVEVGAAYGRVINLLLKNGYKGKLTAVERSRNFHNYLVKQYSGKVDLINEDIKNLNFHNKFDAVLFLWSNISEWNNNKQLNILKQLYEWVMKDGYLILDVFDTEQKPLNATTTKGQFYKYECHYGTVVGYTPTLNEVKEYISYLNPASYKIHPYLTTTKRKRNLFIIMK